MSCERRILLLLIFLGVGLRFWLWWNSFGSNDTHIWAQHGANIREHGLNAAYEKSLIFNHPPLMGEWASFAVGQAKGDLRRFALWMRIPGLVADLITILMLWKYASPAASAIYACSPVAVLVSAYHGNTDALCMAAVVGAALALNRRRWLTAGVLLAIAINVKIIPLLVLPVAFAAIPDLRALRRFLAGLALAILPFLPPAFSVASAMRRNILQYTPTTDQWGIMAFLYPGAQAWYAAHARPILVAILVALALALRFRVKLLPSHAVAIAMCLFLILTPGFGMQYLIYPTGLLALADMHAALLWAIASGVFAIAAYTIGLTGQWPLQSWMKWLSGPTESLGVVVWCVLIYSVALIYRHGQLRGSK